VKSSIFNVIKDDEDGMFIYNTFSSGILKLDNIYRDKFNEIVDNNFEEIEESKDLFENLIKGNMIIEDNIDEISAVKTMESINRFSTSSYSLTIAPTMKCNFRCPYCYEKSETNETMNSKTVDKIKEFFNDTKKNRNHLFISWYGGEPLIAWDIIEELSIEAVELFGDKYRSDIVTNGYLLTEEKISRFKQLHINHMQITIDGPPEVHNKLRRLPNGEDTFFVILNNIKMSLKINPDLNVVIRVNTDKENIESVDKILDYFDEYDLKGKIQIYLAPIENINNSCQETNCFNANEFAKHEMDYISRNLNRGYTFVNIPKYMGSVCAAISSNSLLINSNGDLYKCWDDVGISDLKVGDIFSGMQLNTNMTDWLTYDFLDSECSKCSFLPICMGGCPHKRMNQNIKRCTSLKYRVDETIDLLYELKSKV